MLKVMRGNKFFSVFLLALITGVITVAFVFWGIGPNTSPSATGVVAEIEGVKIPLEEYWRAYDNEYKRVREIYSDEEEIKKLNLKENILDALIDGTVIIIAARKAGITVTDKELQAEILQLPYFQKNGVFNQRIYERSLKLNRLTPQIFEEQLKNDMLYTKMSRLIRETVELTPEEMKTVESLKESNNQVAEAFYASKTNQALKAYIEGIKRKMEIRINWDLIS